MSLGAWPSDKFYDPGRPSWLPYWIDTPTESAMKYDMYPGADTKREYPDPPIPKAGVPVGGYTGAVTDPNALDKLLKADQKAYLKELQSFFATVDAETEAIKKKKDDENKTSWGVAMALAFGFLLMLILAKK